MIYPTSLLGFVTLCAMSSLQSPQGAPQGPQNSLEGTQDTPFLSGSVEVDGVEYPYRLMPPADLEKGKEYPLVLFFHGSGERGSDNEAQLVHFPERMATAEYRAKFPCYVLAPQCPEGTRWYDFDQEKLNPPMQAAVLAMQALLESAPVDRDRLYVTGLSMGGGGLFDLVGSHANWFAAAAPICGRNDPKVAARFTGLPLSIWHGDQDEVIKPSYSREMTAKLNDLGAEVEYHELQGVGHGSWEKAYDPDGVLPWLFSKRRDVEHTVSVAAGGFATTMAADERVAFLGDSITQAGNKPGGYVDRLREALKVSRPGAAVIPAGISGHRVPNLLRRYRADVIDKGASKVFLYIGINDVWHSENGRGTPIEEFEAGLRTLVRDFKESGADVVLATPTVIGEKRNGENTLDEMLDRFAAVSRTVASEEGAVLCDLRLAFETYLGVFNPKNVDRGILTTDGVHLTALGNQLVALEAARALAQ